MALGFTSHYKQGEQAMFGSLTHSSSSSDVESTGTAASSSNLIIGLNFSNDISYDSCDFSSPVVIDYTQYATIAEGSSSAETAGAIASVGGGDFSCTGATASFSGGVSFSGGGCGSGGVSCASFTC